MKEFKRRYRVVYGILRTILNGFMAVGVMNLSLMVFFKEDMSLAVCISAFAVGMVICYLGDDGNGI